MSVCRPLLHTVCVAAETEHSYSQRPLNGVYFSELRIWLSMSYLE